MNGGGAMASTRTLDSEVVDLFNRMGLVENRLENVVHRLTPLPPKDLPGSSSKSPAPTGLLDRLSATIVTLAHIEVLIETLDSVVGGHS